MSNNDKIRQQICILYLEAKHMVLPNSTSDGGAAMNGKHGTSLICGLVYW